MYATMPDQDDAAGIPAPRPKQPIDVEDLVRWALSRFGRMPWLRDGRRELTLNPYTAQLRRREVTTWTLAVAQAGMHFSLGSGRPVEIMPSTDAARVLEAIAGLGDPKLCEQVRICGREKIRPDWKPGVEPRQVEEMKYSRRRRKRRARLVWEPCSPDDLAAVRAEYSRWHAGLTTLARRLDGRLDGWIVTGPAAPVTPWLA